MIAKPDNEIDNILKREVESMLCDGNLKEADLNNLDKRLEVIVQKCKEDRLAAANKPNLTIKDIDKVNLRGSDYNEALSRSAQPRSLNSHRSLDTKRSDFNRSHQEQFNASGQPMQRHKSNIIKPRRAPPKITFADPSSALNMTERRWNEKVQKDLADFNAEQEQKKHKSMEKNMKI